MTDAASKKMCADFEKALDRLWGKKLLEDGTLDLTAVGRSHIQRVLLRSRETLPDANRGVNQPVDGRGRGHRALEDPIHCENIRLLETSMERRS